MEAKEKRPTSIPTNPEEKAAFLRRIAEEIGDRDLFPEKTARARKFLEGLEKSQQRLIP
ncbi:hypothetical protein [Dyadobacter sp. CY323]|uniref:hypothetical protein n=1 Tax=Dyadobacter sp. CY323 TaxID=2907302 RepID=UPI001F3C057E|nr:hypothetical protein [Dyadobacter sp. CY323]MCE6990793.1 hypothetical protein [Dyadobacter sp. CY323]